VQAKITALETKRAELEQNIKDNERKPDRDAEDKAKLASLMRRLESIEEQITQQTTILAEEKKQQTHLMTSGPAGVLEFVIVFRLHPHWAGVVRPNSKAHKFAHKPTHLEVLAVISSMFGIVDVFPCYELRGVYKQSDEFTLMEGAFVVADGMTINIVPRFATVKFHIITWSVEYNRNECRKLMKEHNVSGAVTRDNVDSILVTMEHPDMTVLEGVYRHIEAVVSTEHRGYCHDPQWTYAWGSLESIVRTHKGTAKRDDGVRSWEDEDAKSASTHFNTPLTDDDIGASLM
jgi:hypothetical protein